MLEKRNSLASFFWLIIIILMLNAFFVRIFLKNIKSDQENATQVLEQELNREYSQIFSLINLTNYSLEKIGVEKSADLNKYFKFLESHLIHGGYFIIAFGVADKSGNFLYSSLPCLNKYNCTAANRSYFIKAIEEPVKEHYATIQTGIISNELRIPLCKAILVNGEVLGVTIIGIDIRSLLDSLEYSDSFVITPNKSHYITSEASFMENVFSFLNFSPSYKVIKDIPYEVKVKDYNILAHDLLLKLIPWNLFIICFGAAWHYANTIRSRFGDLFAKVYQDTNYLDMDFATISASRTITGAFDFITKILYRAAHQIKDYKLSIANLEATVGNLIEKTSKNQNELNSLNHEVNGLISDKSVNLNEEYIRILEEFTREYNENNYFVEEQLKLIKQLLQVMKSSTKINIDLNKLLLSMECFESKSFDGNISIRVYEMPLEYLLKIIDKYFSLLCVKAGSFLAIVKQDQTIVFKFTGVLKSDEQLSPKDFLKLGSLVHKINMLAQINGIKVITKDSLKTQTLTLEYPLSLVNETLKIPCTSRFLEDGVLI